ncbi:hypothetical protein CGI59_13820 [Vibrio parahaemolyticus]|nr:MULTISPECIES: hypothetical protein [Vibrio harveyi group]MBS9808159.1 hypothetical protein [Vibrio alginolyticus]MDF4866656.1 hypothetical protein [Vibrio parahaemolyticus]MRE01433.1 hypothetical protein [Vibrio parahaemolyticus]TOI52843.1 hypothetical protein CGI59_13820 [Vibrio parahaemolyticus]HBC3836587.1 hypothetical protein [Vibrio parahaemolyticus]
MDVKSNIEIGSWSLSEERVFMENLLCQRFNFFLVLFGLFLAGGFGANDQQKSLIFGIGFFVELMMWLMVYRAHVKHDWIMKYLYEQHEHPVAQVNEAVKAKGLINFISVSKITGIVMPLSCTLILGVLALYNLKYSSVVLRYLF